MKLNVDPLFSPLDSTHILPLWSSTNCLVKESPIPVPWNFRLALLSNCSKALNTLFLPSAKVKLFALCTNRYWGDGSCFLGLSWELHSDVKVSKTNMEVKATISIVTLFLWKTEVLQGFHNLILILLFMIGLFPCFYARSSTGIVMKIETTPSVRATTRDGWSSWLLSLMPSWGIYVLMCHLPHPIKIKTIPITIFSFSESRYML